MCPEVYAPCKALSQSHHIIDSCFRVWCLWHILNGIGTLLSFLKEQYFLVSITVTVFKRVSHPKHWHILNVFLLVGGTSKNSGTYLKYSYGWRLVAGDLGGATRGCCATQTLSAKPLRLSHLHFASELLYF